MKLKTMADSKFTKSLYQKMSLDSLNSAKFLQKLYPSTSSIGIDHQNSNVY